MKQTLYLPNHLDNTKYYEKYKQLSHHKENLITLYPYKTKEGKWECFLENSYQQEFISLYPIVLLCFDENGSIIDKINLELFRLNARETKLFEVVADSKVFDIKLKLPHVLIDQSRQPLPPHIINSISKILHEKELSKKTLEYIPVQIKPLDNENLQVKLIIINNTLETQTIHQLPMEIIDNELVAKGTFKFDNLKLLPYSCQITQIVFPK